MSGVDAYVQHVDRLLAGARALFPDDGGVAAADTSGLEPPTAPLSAPEETSGLGSTVGQAASAYHGVRSHSGGIIAELHTVAASARSSAHEAGSTAVGIRQTAATHAAAIRPETAAPEAVVLLVTRMDERLAQMQDHLTASRAALEDAALRVREHVQSLSTLGQG